MATSPEESRSIAAAPRLDRSTTAAVGAEAEAHIEVVDVETEAVSQRWTQRRGLAPRQWARPHKRGGELPGSRHARTELEVDAVAAGAETEASTVEVGADTGAASGAEGREGR